MSKEKPDVIGQADVEPIGEIRRFLSAYTELNGNDLSYIVLGIEKIIGEQTVDALQTKIKELKQNLNYSGNELIFANFDKSTLLEALKKCEYSDDKITQEIATEAIKKVEEK